ncbi:hypothetical protein BDV96DRAFT_483361 [Lophiotrema nucula]|uniref:Uncharacterized protein n=1 Tax=Lophiotrema nucula TaxID=690887 RepID=A0A6A5ZV20_9PLEO|nr:hypothetical protein BDV96DRAFT_483361 [Lophiotrema nucula]
MPKEREQEEQEEDSTPFAPSYADVRLARAILKSRRLPTELALDILELARYWPEQTFSSTSSSRSSITGSDKAATLAFAVPVFEEDFAKQFGCERSKVKEIEVELKSHDQGWTSQGGHGTYQTSSWTELSILHNKNGANSVPFEELAKRFQAGGAPDVRSSAIEYSGWEFATRPDLVERYPQGGEVPIGWFLQANKVAAPITNASIVWGTDRFEGNEGTGSGEGFLDALREGDRILLWARAKWRGWECHVTYVKLTVRYGF